jgi:hypothetical protein
MPEEQPIDQGTLPNAAPQPTKQQYEVPFRRIGANQKGLFTKSLGKGSLMVAKYDYWKHDPYPLILVSGFYSDGRLAGVNLHYLTFRYIKGLTQAYCNNRTFGYQLIKGDKYIVQAFRTYKKAGLKQARLIDSDFLLNVLGTARSYSPNEVEKIRQHVQEQLRQQVNPRSDQMILRHGKEFMKAFTPQQDYGHGRMTKADGRINPNLASQPGQSASIPGTPPVGSS